MVVQRNGNGFLKKERKGKGSALRAKERNTLVDKFLSY
jgi:hypothetical protein